jgi:prepilin-type N-terminal cleavage/methylation domain-containing protein
VVRAMARISTAGKSSNSCRLSDTSHPAASRYLRQSGEGGFTLIELIVVCALIGIMLSLAVPSFRTKIINDPLKAAVRKSIGLVREVRETAARRHKPYLLHINHIDNSIWFEAVEKVDEKEEAEDAEETDESKWTVPETVEIAGLWVAGEKKSALESTTVWISPEGYMENTVIGFEDDDGSFLAVEFQTFIDEAVIHDEEPSQ